MGFENPTDYMLGRQELQRLQRMDPIRFMGQLPLTLKASRRAEISQQINSLTIVLFLSPNRFLAHQSADRP
jgi:hypothetical protein